MNNRRNIFNILAITLLLPSDAFAQQADTEEAKAASKSFYTALAVLDDGAAMEKLWAHTDYITYVGPGSKTIIVGWDAQKKYWADTNKVFSLRTVSLSDQHIHVNGNLAWEMGQESGVLTTKDGKEVKIDFIATNVYEKIDGRWLIVSHHVQPKPQ